MKRVRSPYYNAIVASAAAGPIFLLSLIAAGAYALLPKPIEVEPEYLPAILAALVPASVVGFLISFLPNAIGTHMLSAAGEISETAREPAIWIAVGAGLGYLIALLFGAATETGVDTFALVATSAICAGLCRWQTSWEG